MTALTELREEAALQPDGSRAKRLLTWAEIHFGDSAERISERRNSPRGRRPSELDKAASRRGGGPADER